MSFPLAQLTRFVFLGQRLDRHAAQLVELGERTEKTLTALDDVGRRNLVLGRELAELARASIEGNREAASAVDGLTERADRLLEHAGALEAELPALRDALTTLGRLEESTAPLSAAAPVVASAAERVDRVASRIPGMRDG